jgi:hypothetical protein
MNELFCTVEDPHQYLYTCIVIVCEHGLLIVICCALSNKELLLLLKNRWYARERSRQLEKNIFVKLNLSGRIFLFNQ